MSVAMLMIRSSLSFMLAPGLAVPTRGKVGDTIGPASSVRGTIVMVSADGTGDQMTKVTGLRLLAKLFGQEFIYQLRTGLAFGGLHHLAYEETQHGFFAGAVLLKLLGVGSYDLVDNFFKR